MTRFEDRRDAGRRLATRLGEYADRSDVLVLGLPRGGVPVAAEVARVLKAPLDVFLVRKLGAPAHPELAMGAIAEGAVEVLNRALIDSLGLSRQHIDQVAAHERLILDRHDQLYRGGRRAPVVRDRVVIVVDDGLATGATMEAAVLALRVQHPSRIVVAVPVGARESCDRLATIADQLVCAHRPSRFEAVGQWYADFSQTTDDEVIRLLRDAGNVSSITTVGPSASVDPVTLIRGRAVRSAGAFAENQALIDMLGRARIVLLGEASHGTHEFYAERAALTRRLIEEKQFAGVALEADWPDAYRVNRYVRGAGSDRDATEALADFKRFPSWMWRNADVLDFVGWLRSCNESRPSEEQAGFYGLDLYSLHSSMQAVVAYLERIDPAGAARARQRYACFDRFGDDAHSYAQVTGLGLSENCERDVITQLLELRRKASEYASRDGRLAADDLFAAEQNARVVRNAEAYYRTMIGGHIESWNLRDRHMAETLDHLMKFLEKRGGRTKLVVWAHNSHLGDARATEMGERGELNLGQLAREAHGADVVAVGFTTHSGTVTAATDWDGAALRRHVRPSLPGSYERLFHDVGIDRFWLMLRQDLELASALGSPRLARAIGVIYRPDTERRSHYFKARLSDQFDVVMHIDQTRAVEPLERTSEWEAGEYAETYPSGL